MCCVSQIPRWRSETHDNIKYFHCGQKFADNFIVVLQKLWETTTAFKICTHTPCLQVQANEISYRHLPRRGGGCSNPKANALTLNFFSYCTIFERVHPVKTGVASFRGIIWWCTPNCLQMQHNFRIDDANWQFLTTYIIDEAEKRNAKWNEGEREKSGWVNAITVQTRFTFPSFGLFTK